jgi:hypothetical protein
MGRPQDETTKQAEEFRNYKDSARQATVSNFYKLQHMNQTLEYAQKNKGTVLFTEGTRNELLGCCVAVERDCG